NEGRILSAMGIGSLLMDGIGNTIRVSLTEDPVNEIEVAQQIIQASGGRAYKAQFIACPSCGRTKYNIQKALQEVKAKTQHLAGLKIAVMGCIVNGPGEMADADFGYIGAGEGLVHLYKGKECVQKNIPEELAVDALVVLIEKNKFFESENK
ncbi:MAG: flavodoxin-dependent (E)-4-hydroxy-3-methylbut-2-enyl-diphosphate synthase, partial [Bacteroidales bacterium]